MAQKVIKTVRPDSKGRITLGKLLNGVSSVRVMVEEDGKIILEPYTEIPMREAWLYNNPEAFEKVSKGIRQASAGSLHDVGTFSHYDDEDDA